MIRAGVLGATGYAGQELIRLLYHHRQVELVKIMSNSYPQRRFSQVYRNFTGRMDQTCRAVDYASLADGLDVLFAALPYGVLMEHLTEEILDGVRLIDLGVDYRLMDEKEYLKYYGKNHLSMRLADRFVYGLCEWNADRIRASKHVANPGCYATAMELALLPLVQEGVIRESIVADGKCSVSGAGRTLTLGTHFAEANESAKAYKITDHPHTRECVKAIAAFTKKEPELTFVPHLVPMQRGLLVTCYTTLTRLCGDETVREIYRQYYEDKPFVQLLDRGLYVETKWVRNSNMCHINFEINHTTGRLILVAALDNLIKGAAGQAVQNMNLMFDLPQNAGLEHVPACI